MRQTIYVTQAHIKKARQLLPKGGQWRPYVSKCGSCPIALALGEAGYYDASVTYSNIRVGPPDYQTFWPVSQELLKWLMDFDAGLDVPELTF